MDIHYNRKYEKQTIHMKPIVAVILISCALLFILSACASKKKNKEENQYHMTISSLQWRLLSVQSEEDGVLEPAKDNLPTLMVSEDGEVSGYSGCNHFSGKVTIKGSGLKFGNMVSTRKFCFESMNIENALLKALSNSDNYTIKNGDLLLKEKDNVVATFTSFR